MFVRSFGGPPWSWDCRSLLLLKLWAVADYADGFLSESYASYNRYVLRRLLAVSTERDLCSRSSHVVLAPHHIICSAEAHPWKDMFGSPLSWACLISTRVGRRSRARVQVCIFCGVLVGNPYQHVLANCSTWTSQRLGCLGALNSAPARAVDRVQSLLMRSPRDSSFPRVAERFADIDARHTDFGNLAAFSCLSRVLHDF